MKNFLLVVAILMVAAILFLVMTIGIPQEHVENVQAFWVAFWDIGPNQLVYGPAE